MILIEINKHKFYKNLQTFCDKNKFTYFQVIQKRINYSEMFLWKEQSKPILSLKKGIHTMSISHYFWDLFQLVALKGFQFEI